MKETFSSEVGKRLKEVRAALGIDQAAAAALCNVTREQWGRYERGVSVPGGEVLAGLLQRDVDVAYILSGQRRQSAQAQPYRGGVVIAAEPEAVYGRGPPLDLQRLVVALTAVAEGIADTDRKLPPARHAELVLAAYELLGQGGAARDQLVKLIRAATAL